MLLEESVLYLKLSYSKKGKKKKKHDHVATVGSLGPGRACLESFLLILSTILTS